MEVLSTIVKVQSVFDLPSIVGPISEDDTPSSTKLIELTCRLASAELPGERQHPIAHSPEPGAVLGRPVRGPRKVSVGRVWI